MSINRCYTIDALSAAGDKAWRLQDDETWRPCTYSEALQQHDARITDNDRAEYWVGRRLKKDNETVLAPQAKAGTFDFFMRGIFAHAVVHHLQDTPLPDSKQMESVIASLTPGTAWLLYLDADGQFQALDSNSEGIIGNLNIAVRGEIASSPDYIGAEATANATRMDHTYRQFLGGWLDHLKSSNMNVFVPDIEQLKEESDYITAIRDWRHEQ